MSNLLNQTTFNFRCLVTMWTLFVIIYVCAYNYYNILLNIVKNIMVVWIWSLL